VVKHAYCPVLVSKGMPDDWSEREEQEYEYDG